MEDAAATEVVNLAALKVTALEEGGESQDLASVNWLRNPHSNLW